MEENRNLVNLRDFSVEIDNAMMHVIMIEKKQNRMFDASNRDILHNHSYSEIFACTKGTVNIKLRDEVVTLGAGDVCIVPTELMHSVVYHEITHEKEWASVGIGLFKKQKITTRNFYRRFGELLIETPFRVYRGVPDIAEEVLSLYYDAFEEGSLTPVFKVGLLLARLASLPPELHGNVPGAKKTGGIELEVDISRLTLIEEIINLRYLEDLKSEQIADLVFISRRQLDRIIMRRYGMSLRQVLNDKRLKYAVRLLNDTVRTTEEIAENAGYNSKAAFYRAFFDAYGMTPAEYRKTLGLLY